MRAGSRGTQAAYMRHRPSTAANFQREMRRLDNMHDSERAHWSDRQGTWKEVVQAMHVPLPRRARGIRGVHVRGQDTLSVGVRLEPECGAVVANTRALECGNTYAEERERVGATYGRSLPHAASPNYAPRNRDEKGRKEGKEEEDKGEGDAPTQPIHCMERVPLGPRSVHAQSPWGVRSPLASGYVNGQRLDPDPHRRHGEHDGSTQGAAATIIQTERWR
ncbi:hypothetical protein B0H13DRAFT_2539551 [Mycena leptocephala]|nr:hypothetical protein B0H13DRAFT_2539551 [Mycena leptocephala]